MQNKGFVKVIAVLLSLICVYYLSFSFVTNHYEKKAEAMYGWDKATRSVKHFKLAWVLTSRVV